MQLVCLLTIILLLKPNSSTELVQITTTKQRSSSSVVIREKNRQLERRNEYCRLQTVYLSCGKKKTYRVCKQVEVDPSKETMRKLSTGENMIPSCILEIGSNDERYDCTSSSYSFSSKFNFSRGTLIKASPFNGCIGLINRVNRNSEAIYRVRYDKKIGSLGFRLSQRNLPAVSEISARARRLGILPDDRLVEINTWKTESKSFQEIAKKLKFASYPLTLTFESSQNGSDGATQNFAVLMQRGACDFDVKLKHAYEIGASALIVVDTNKDKNPVTMSTSIQDGDENDQSMRLNVTAVSIDPNVFDLLPPPTSNGVVSNNISLLYYFPSQTK